MSEFLPTKPKPCEGRGEWQFKEGRFPCIIAGFKLPPTYDKYRELFAFTVLLVHAEFDKEKQVDIPPIRICLNGETLASGLADGKKAFLGEGLWERIIRAIGLGEVEEKELPIESYIGAPLCVTVSKAKSYFIRLDDIQPCDEIEAPAVKAFARKWREENPF